MKYSAILPKKDSPDEIHLIFGIKQKGAKLLQELFVASALDDKFVL